MLVHRGSLSLLGTTLIALALLTAAPAAALNPSNYEKSAFCDPREPSRDFGFSRLPAIAEMPADGKLPFAPPGVVALGYPTMSRVQTGKASFGFSFWNENLRSTARLDWIVSARMWLLGAHGRPLREIDRETVEIGRLDPENGPGIFLETLGRRGFYRFDIQFADRAGAELGAYSAYLKVARSFWKARLRLDRRGYRPGQLVVIRLENLGTRWISFGEDFAVQRLSGGTWVPDPELTPDVWAAWLGMAGPGSGRCGAFLLPRDVPAGRYRIVKRVSESISPRRSRGHRLAAPFTVK